MKYEDRALCAVQGREDVAVSEQEPDRLIPLKEVMQMVPLKRTAIYARGAAGTFPVRRDLGGGVVAWSRNEVLAWIESRPLATKQTNMGVGKGVAIGTSDKKAA